MSWGTFTESCYSRSLPNASLSKSRVFKPIVDRVSRKKVPLLATSTSSFDSPLQTIKHMKTLYSSRPSSCRSAVKRSFKGKSPGWRAMVDSLQGGRRHVWRDLHMRSCLQRFQTKKYAKWFACIDCWVWLKPRMYVY